jgi:hypothetical protein
LFHSETCGSFLGALAEPLFEDVEYFDGNGQERQRGMMKNMRRREGTPMCRNIKPLFNFEPPASEQEIQMAALQFVRKVSGMNAPSQVNQEAFHAAVDAIAETTSILLSSLETHAPAKNRAEEEEKARAKSARRFS